MVLVTNHALLLTDNLSGSTVLPAYGTLVIDEAHHLEDVATQCLTREMAREDLERWLDQMRVVLRRAVSALYYLPDWGDREQQIKAAGAGVKKAAKELFAFLEGVLRTENLKNSWGGAMARCLKEDERHLVLETKAGIWYHALVKEISALLHFGTTLVQETTDWEETWTQELGLWLEEGQRLLEVLTHIVENEDANWVQWVEGRVRGDNLVAVLLEAPVTVAEELYAGLFRSSGGKVLTSATLTVEGSFAHFMERTGLDRVPAEHLIFKRIGSPFAYEEKAALCVIRDLPLLGQVPVKDYFLAVAEALFSLTKSASVKTLVLFTAKQMMREVVERLRRLEKEGFVVLAQGIDGGRTRLVEEFRGTPRTVLCGTASFWEGIDIPGAGLRLVVIVKLPFPPYETPIFAARRAHLRRKGQDDFQALSLPYAVLRFKQGFGRLIRSGRDDGVVVVLDRRLVEKRYGTSFIRSLPTLPVKIMSLNEAGRWLRERFKGEEDKGDILLNYSKTTEISG